MQTVVLLPMHTATRLAVALLPRVRALNPTAHLCFYGLYAPVNAAYLRSLGAQIILGGEFEAGLLRLAEHISFGDPDFWRRAWAASGTGSMRGSATTSCTTPFRAAGWQR